MNGVFRLVLDLLSSISDPHQQQQQQHNRRLVVAYLERLKTLRTIMDAVPQFDVQCILDDSSTAVASKYTTKSQSQSQSQSHEQKSNVELFADNFKLIKCCDMRDLCCRLAEYNRIDELKLCWKYHISEVKDIASRLKIVATIPEVVRPDSYIEILPQCTNDEASIWPYLSHWYNYEKDNEEKEEEEKKKETDKTKTSEDWSTNIEKWYVSRICEIEKRCGNIENSLLLCQFAQERGCRGADINQLRQDLNWCNKVCYEWGMNDNTLTLQKLKDMKATDQVWFVLRHCADQLHTNKSSSKFDDQKCQSDDEWIDGLIEKCQFCQDNYKNSVREPKSEEDFVLPKILLGLLPLLVQPIA
ncbi:hypothetical protein RFI_20460 [Reticulomyxa filosa]|uniref:Uncharacterized protein n=1 Tax=Reticulomyxa filosa TaxID=46433 RepID=X6MTY7_RETFI|nr:hypothetical protein RFI_20460 [Reticulomyxa filosa]|eukprot:ETO16877.1 hypothetical protein RFI_20460 [Reticulomyxa filosa]